MFIVTKGEAGGKIISCPEMAERYRGSEKKIDVLKYKRLRCAVTTFFVLSVLFFACTVVTLVAHLFSVPAGGK